jgi:hypothetical protein
MARGDVRAWVHGLIWVTLQIEARRRRHTRLPVPKGYWKFDASQRVNGWNTWLTFSLSPPAPGSLTANPNGFE